MRVKKEGTFRINDPSLCRETTEHAKPGCFPGGSVVKSLPPRRRLRFDT